MELVCRTVVIAALIVLAPSACASGDDAETPSPATNVASTDSTRGQPDSVPTPAAGAAGATPGPAIDGVSVMTGVYTAAQAARGQDVYAATCAQCHTMAQHSGGTFAAAWNNRKVFDLYDIVSNTMPLDNPGGLSEQEYIDVVAYMLQLNGAPPGKSALGTDPVTLKGLRIEVRPAAGQ